MQTPVKVLYLEDDEMDRRRFLRMMRDKNLPYDLTLAETVAEARARLAESHFDLIVADYHLPDGHGTDLFAEVPDTPFVLLTGTLEESLALRTLERGADDYLPKTADDRHLDALPFTIEKTLHRKHIRDRERQLTGQLHEAEAQLRLQAAALEAAPSAISLSKTDRQGTIVWVNAAFATLTGYSANEAVGRSHNILHSGRQDGAFYRELWQTIQRGEIWRGELVNKRKDGTLYHEEMGITPLRDEHGQITHYVAVKQDITERKQAEEALRQSEERLRLLVDSVKDYAIYMLDRHGRVTTWNLGAERVNGWKTEEVVGRNFSVFYLPEDVAAGKPQRDLEMAVRDGSRQQEIRRLRKDGSTYWADCILTAITNARGELVGFSKVTRDITERKRADEALRESEANLQLALNAANFGMWKWDLLADELTWSDECKALFGLKPDTAITYTRFLQAVHAEDRQKVDEALSQALEMRAVYNAEMRTAWPDGSLHWVGVIGRGYYDSYGKALRMAGVAFDLTPIKQQSEQAAA